MSGRRQRRARRAVTVSARTSALQPWLEVEQLEGWTKSMLYDLARDAWTLAKYVHVAVEVEGVGLVFYSTSPAAHRTSLDDYTTMIGRALDGRPL